VRSVATKRVITLAALALAMTASTAGGAVQTSRACTYKARGLPIYARLSGDATPAACAWFNKALKGTVWKAPIPGKVYGIWKAKGAWHAKLTIYSTEEQFGVNYCNQVTDDLSADFIRIK
jgi:hypothetical protein